MSSKLYVKEIKGFNQNMIFFNSSEEVEGYTVCDERERKFTRHLFLSNLVR